MRGEKMNRRLKRPVVYSLYVIGFGLLLGGILLLEFNNKKLDTKKPDYQYVSKTGITREDIPVVNTKTTIIRPYTDSDVKIVKNFYNYQGTEDEQKESIIYYQDTYMPSSGVSYGKDTEFDVVSILDGKVTKVSNDDTVGNIITIEHDNGIVSTYESIKDITVKEGDTVKQGMKIATSSTANITSDLKNHLYFELSIKEKLVNPEDYFDKSLDEIGA